VTPEMGGHIEFCGPVSHEKLPEINARASVLVYPSWMETQGIVVVEGMASGKAVISGRNGPGPELIEDGLSGVLCDPHHPDSIADALIQLLLNPEMRTVMGRRARQRAMELFSNEVLIPRNFKFYEDCLHG
jgi:glycosyltransferase involved in cell wall biosynthesis